MRSVWFLAGAGAGVYVMVKARRVAEALTPEGLRDRLAALELGAHLFGEEVRTGMAEKETELRLRLGVALDGAPQLAAARSGNGGPATHNGTAAERELEE
ncbi:MAG TPA: DUF6167 family protein [Marmoricola sp.]|nr:DUF6167 family protein [Marmoricola sp.]